jgi:hypothetical protein
VQAGLLPECRAQLGNPRLLQREVPHPAPVTAITAEFFGPGQHNMAVLGATDTLIAREITPGYRIFIFRRHTEEPLEEE